jgi:hypothetical protein
VCWFFLFLKDLKTCFVSIYRSFLSIVLCYTSSHWLFWVLPSHLGIRGHIHKGTICLSNIYDHPIFVIYNSVDSTTIYLGRFCNIRCLFPYCTQISRTQTCRFYLAQCIYIKLTSVQVHIKSTFGEKIDLIYYKLKKKKNTLFLFSYLSWNLFLWFEKKPIKITIRKKRK